MQDHRASNQSSEFFLFIGPLLMQYVFSVFYIHFNSKSYSFTYAQNTGQFFSLLTNSIVSVNITQAPYSNHSLLSQYFLYLFEKEKKNAKGREPRERKRDSSMSVGVAGLPV